MIRHARMRGHRALFLPGLDHASIAAQFVLDGILAKEGREPPVARPRALPRADARVRRRRRASVMLAQQRRVGRVGRLGPPALHDGRRLGARPSGSPSSGSTGRTWPTGPRRSSTGARAAGRASATSRSSRRRRPGRCGRSATTCSTRRPAHPIPTPRSRSPRPGRRRSSATRPSPSIPTTSATRRSSGAGSASRSSSATCPIIADAGRRSGVRDRGRQDHAGPRPRRPRDRPAPRPRRRRRSSPTTRPIAGTGTPYDGLDRYEAREPDRRRPRGARRPRRARAARDGHRPLPAQRRRRRAAPQDPVVRADRAAGRRAPSRRPARGRTRILPERFEKTWEHWLTNIRDWNVSRQLWWGHRIPAWYCPDGHVTVSSAEDGPDACEVVRPPGGASCSQDPDIFDTWFSSGLWPFSTLGWPDDDARPRDATTRPRSWRPATTSSSSGSPG